MNGSSMTNSLFKMNSFSNETPLSGNCSAVLLKKLIIEAEQRQILNLKCTVITYCEVLYEYFV